MEEFFKGDLVEFTKKEKNNGNTPPDVDSLMIVLEPQSKFQTQNCKVISCKCLEVYWIHKMRLQKCLKKDS